MAKYIDADRLRAEIERLYNLIPADYSIRADYAKNAFMALLSFLDTLQEPDRLHFLPMVRLVEMIRTDEWNDRGKRYAEKLVSALENEGYPIDARLIRNHIKYMDGEDVPMATMDFKQEPEVDLESKVTFDCISKKVTMTIRELINYYIDRECCDVAEECGF